VTAVDPNPAMLRWARSKPGADSVTWIEGTAVDLVSHQFDMALMTSHVAQVYVEDSEWCDVLAHLRRRSFPEVCSVSTREIPAGGHGASGRRTALALDRGGSDTRSGECHVCDSAG
jgi:hypothetical protein